MPARVAGFVLRAQNKSITVQFYTRLGLNFHEHKHGGPLHFEVKPLALDFVVELYQGSRTYPEDTLMIEVDSLADAIEVCTGYGIFPVTEVVLTDTMRFVYIVDMDSRTVMLLEKVT